MNKSLRYLIFALLIIGVGYAVYYLMNKPAETVIIKTEEQKVAEDVQQGATEDQSLAQAEDAMPAEEVSEVKVEQEEIVKPEDVKVEEAKKEEMNKDSKPAKR